MSDFRARIYQFLIIAYFLIFQFSVEEPNLVTEQQELEKGWWKLKVAGQFRENFFHKSFYQNAYSLIVLVFRMIASAPNDRINLVMVHKDLQIQSLPMILPKAN